MSAGKVLITLTCLALTGCLNWEALSPDGGIDGGMDASVSSAIEGFGSVTTGGDTQPEVQVTTLADDGAGSLREALRGNNRRIVFTVAGTINLQSDLELTGASFITIDGATGITLAGRTLSLQPNTHDVIIRHLRIRNTSDDALRIQGAQRIAIDHVSATGASSGCIDITEDASDITVQWSLLHKTTTGLATSLVGFGAHHVTLHHNFYSGPEGNPQIANGNANTQFPNADVRNNLVWNWADNGISLSNSGRANVVANFVQSSTNPSLGVFDVGTTNQFFTRGNVSGSGATLDTGAASEFSAPAITEDDACAAARKILMTAGAQPRDSIDQGLLAGVTLSSCP